MWWIPALATAAVTGAKAIWGRPKTDTMSERRRILGTLAGQGLYSPADIRKTVGAVSQEFATGEQKQTSLMRGYLEKAGLGGSIAGARALSQVQEPRKRAVAGTRTQMELKNVETQRQATIDYANLVDTLHRQKSLEDAQFKSGLFEAAGQIGSSAFGGYMQQKELALKGREVGAMEKHRSAFADYYTAMADKTRAATGGASEVELYACKGDFEIAAWAKKHGWDFERALDLWSQNQLE